MKKAKIYIPTKTAMQSGRGKTKKWVLSFETKNTKTNPLMGWESGEDTLSEVILTFSSKEKAIKYAKKNNILYQVIEPKKSSFIIKSYADNFLKD
jgi:ETC complex I subunit conserved region.|tara:strand:+ start:1890 stop:2174 length:285 start_codon:yes stop_codon:yes gene_type:complete